MKHPLADYRNAGFFVMRTPLLPTRCFEKLSRGLTASGLSGAPLEAALEADRRAVRAQLVKQLRDPAVREALFLASGDLEQHLEAWLERPDSDLGRRVEASVARYLSRMSMRATPFGLFAGVSVGRLTHATELRLAARERWARFTRLDNDALSVILDEVNQRPAFRARAIYRPNTSLARSGGTLRYVETVTDQARATRTFHFVSIAATPAIDSTLDRAAGGARRETLVRALVESEGEVSEPEAEAFVDALIDGQLLVSSLSVAVTGEEPIDDAIAVLAEAGELDATSSLREVRERLGALNRRELGAPKSEYERIHALLESGPAGHLGASRLFQVNLEKPPELLTVGRDVVADVRAALGALRRISPSDDTHAMSQFALDFTRRFGDRAVPLAEALDAETGVALASTRQPRASGLLEGLDDDRPPSEQRRPFGRRERYLLGKLQQLWARHASEWSLDEADLAALENAAPTPLPTSLAVLVELGRTPSGTHGVSLAGTTGHTSVQWLGRFAHHSPELTELVRALAQAEQRLNPEAVLAEIVHLPEGRLGNITCRPVVRPWEIPYLGKSGAPTEGQLPLDDLVVTVEDGRVVLRSIRLGREVRPTMASAHNSEGDTLPIYRFLNRLPLQDTAGSIAWSWGPFGRAPHLPRVRIAGVVVAKEQWNLPATELLEVSRAERAERFLAAQRLRARWGLPRFVVLTEGDNALPVDLESVVAIDALVASRPSEEWVTLTELWPAPGAAAVEGPGGTYVAELIVPFVRQGPSVECPRPASANVRDPATVGRTELRWFAGESRLDGLLSGHLLGRLTTAAAQGALQRWWFERATGGGAHLRVGLEGPGLDVLLQDLGAIGSSLVAEGELIEWAVVHRRESGATDDTELWFHDSVAAATLIEQLQDADETWRWKLALASLHRLLDDLAIEEPQTGGGERGAASAVSRRYRAELQEIGAILGGSHSADVFRRAAPALDRRSEALRAVVAQRRGTPGWEGSARDLLRRCVRRLVLDAPERHEAVLMEFIRRWRRSEAARARTSAAPRQVEGVTA